MQAEVSFTGEVLPAICPCHRGKFVVLVCQNTPLGLTPIDREFFDTEAEAEKQVQAVIFRAVDKLFAGTPLSRDMATKVTVAKYDPSEPGPMVFEEIDQPPVPQVEKENRDPNPNLH